MDAASNIIYSRGIILLKAYNFNNMNPLNIKHIILMSYGEELSGLATLTYLLMSSHVGT